VCAKYEKVGKGSLPVGHNKQRPDRQIKFNKGVEKCSFSELNWLQNAINDHAVHRTCPTCTISGIVMW